MNLLSDTERLEIRQVMGDIADTFHNTPVTFKVYSGSIDRMGRGTKVLTETIVNCLVVYNDMASDSNLVGEAGVLSRQGATVYANIQRLNTAGLLDENYRPKFETETSLLVIDGEEYRMEVDTVSGFLDLADVPINYTLTCSKEPRRA